MGPRVSAVTRRLTLNGSSSIEIPWSCNALRKRMWQREMLRSARSGEDSPSPSDKRRDSCDIHEPRKHLSSTGTQVEEREKSEEVAKGERRVGYTALANVPEDFWRLAGTSESSDTSTRDIETSIDGRDEGNELESAR